LILEIFCGALALTALASAQGWPVSQPTDLAIDGLDLTKRAHRRLIEDQLKRDDPFCLVIPFPCGPWNSLTYFNMSRYPQVRERVLQTQEEHKPMLKWVSELARDRIRKGRVVLLENG